MPSKVLQRRDVLVTACRTYGRREGQEVVTYVWDCLPWEDLKSGHCIKLFSRRGLDLYPGERTNVAGSIFRREGDYSDFLLVVGSYAGRQFVLRSMQVVNLENPKRAAKGDATYASWIRADINGVPTKINVATLAHGKVVENGSPAVRINNIVFPGRRKGYLLYADFL